MKQFIPLSFAWILSFHGLDYQSIIDKLDSMPKKEAEKAQIFPCWDEDGNKALCLKYWEPSDK